MIQVLAKYLRACQRLPQVMVEAVTLVAVVLEQVVTLVVLEVVVLEIISSGVNARSGQRSAIIS